MIRHALFFGRIDRVRYLPLSEYRTLGCLLNRMEEQLAPTSCFGAAISGPPIFLSFHRSR